jgi:hypothetical protein
VQPLLVKHNWAHWAVNLILQIYKLLCDSFPFCASRNSFNYYGNLTDYLNFVPEIYFYLMQFIVRTPTSLLLCLSIKIKLQHFLLH